LDRAVSPLDPTNTRPGTVPPSLLDCSLDDLTALLARLGEPAYRARQVWRWVYKGLATSYDEMTDLPRSLRARLASTLPLSPLALAHHQIAGDETTKVLLRASDHRLVEAVLMRYPDRTTICLSSQLGCAVGCVFCQTGLSGFDRNLTLGEMLGQVLHLAREARAGGRSVSNVVLMGMGEPLINYATAIAFIARMTDPDAFGLGARHITVSTAGIVPRIRQLAGEPYQINLAVSLHAADDALRNALVPLNRRYPLADLMDACRYFVTTTKRRISFEYTIIRDVNDRTDQARALAILLRGLLCHVNLIPLNPVDATLSEPDPSVVRAFAAELNRLGIPTTIRYSRGRGIAAACGQLRARHERDGGAGDRTISRPRRTDNAAPRDNHAAG
jgi:23S rRNA (adenine2503-C2)-methyltransferase